MRKVLHLIAVCLIAASSNAQERMTNPKNSPVNIKTKQSSINYNKQEELGLTSAAKTTAIQYRWYSYCDFVDMQEAVLSSSTSLVAQYIWNDTTAMMEYPSSTGTDWRHNTMTSVGLITDPSYGYADLSGFNSLDYYLEEMRITPTNAYTVDTIRFYGRYGFNPANTSVVDTIRVTFVYGDGSSSSDIFEVNTMTPSILSDYGLGAGDTLKNNRLRYDPITNRATGSTAIVSDIILDNSGATPAWGDTLENGTYVGEIILPGGGVTVPAGNIIGASITFISGDPLFVAHDTVHGSSMGYKYNAFRPYVMFRGISSTPTFARYSPTDRNSGMFKTQPDTAHGWGGEYIPNWFWTEAGGASAMQFPLIDFHLTCSDCPKLVDILTTKGDEPLLATSVYAYPNPASNELSIQFALATDAKVTVSLSNVLGQKVANKEFANVLHGTAVFNTSSLAAGVYMYTVNTNSVNKTGRVVISR